MQVPDECRQRRGQDRTRDRDRNGGLQRGNGAHDGSKLPESTSGHKGECRVRSRRCARLPVGIIAMNDEGPIESEPPASARESPWESVRRSGSQALALALGVAALETLIRTVLGSASFPDAGSAIQELWTRSARILTLTPALVAFDLTLVAAQRHPWLREHVSPVAAHWLATCCRPGVVLRAALVYGVVTVILARTVGRQYQLYWHSGATFACAAVPPSWPAS